MLETDIVDTTLTTIPQDEAERPIAPRREKGWMAWHRLALGGITLVSVFMNFYQLGMNGFSSYNLWPARLLGSCRWRSWGSSL